MAARVIARLHFCPKTEERINGGGRAPSNEREGVSVLQLPASVPSNRAAVLIGKAPSFVTLRGLRPSTFGKLVLEHPAGMVTATGCAPAHWRLLDSSL